MMIVWAGLELANSGRPEYLEEAMQRAREVLRRQVQQDSPEGIFFGQFRTIDEGAFTEKAFIHHHVGYDTGILFDHYIFPLMELCRQ